MRLLKIAGRDPDGNAKPFSLSDNGEALVKESPELSQQIEDIKDKDFATQTTLAAILAKLSADPATQTTLNALKTLFDSGNAQVQLKGSYPEYRQLSTDPEPDATTAGKGATIYQIDTGIAKMSNGTAWEVL